MPLPPPVRRIARRTRTAGQWVRHRLKLYQSDARLQADAQDYWTGAPGDVPEQNFHWRGSGMFADDAVWLSVGRAHFELFEGFARLVGLRRPMDRVLEWGCGGGANAVRFARDAAEFVGVDVSRPSLDECGKQLAREGVAARYVPLACDVADPEAAAARVPGPCDLFLCTYVFEVFPSEAYGLRMLRLAAGLLRPGGMALVQIKYQTDELRTRSRRWGYRRDIANMTTYRVEGFWEQAAAAGLTPRAVTLVPRVPAVHDERYAYFALTK